VETHEIILVHGYSHDGYYIVSLFWDRYNFLDASKINWVREGQSVNGYSTDNHMIICERINGNSKREATCFKEYKNLLRIPNSVHFKIPIPEPWKFNEEEILEEISKYK
jgi:hypothetical protein